MDLAGETELIVHENLERLWKKVSFKAYPIGVFHCQFHLMLAQTEQLNPCWTEIVRIMSTQKCNLNTIIKSNGDKVLWKTCKRPQMKANEIYQSMKLPDSHALAKIRMDCINKFLIIIFPVRS